MRIVLFPSGTRGDFQPLLVLAVGLQAAGHDPLLVGNPNYHADAAAFGVPFSALGVDNEKLLRGKKLGTSQVRAAFELFRRGRGRVVSLIEGLIPLARGADAIVGGGTQRSAATVAELYGIPYINVVYTPQMFRSSHHAPFVTPILDLPGFANRMLWRGFAATNHAVFAGPLNRKRRALGLAPIRDFQEHFYPSDSLVASDPELAVTPPDAPPAHLAIGALPLPDERPLDAEVERFLAAGPAPVYLGFGSMVDPDPDRATAIFVEAARAAGMRLVLLRGWSGYGAKLAADDRVLVVGPVSHRLLFSRVATIVHHGGAGTTSAAARSGRPQIVIPHVFDQFQWGRWVRQAGIGPEPIARRRLTAEHLAAALRAATDPGMCERAAALGAELRRRDPVAAGVAAIVRRIAEHRR